MVAGLLVHDTSHPKRAATDPIGGCVWMALFAGLDASLQCRRDGGGRGGFASRSGPEHPRSNRGDSCVAFPSFHATARGRDPDGRRLPFGLYRRRRRAAPASWTDPPAGSANVHDGIRPGLRGARQPHADLPERLPCPRRRVSRRSPRRMPAHIPSAGGTGLHAGVRPGLRPAGRAQADIPECLRGTRRGLPRRRARRVPPRGRSPAATAVLHAGIRSGLRSAWRTPEDVSECLRGAGGRLQRPASRGMPLDGSSLNHAIKGPRRKMRALRFAQAASTM